MPHRVLIIDDEENIRQVIRLTLEASSYKVEEARDGYEALAILGSDSEWDVILLDQRLPAMEGTEVLRRIKVLAPKARVVMMTAFPSVELAVKAMKLGATDFLRKPMTPEVVRNSVAAAITKEADYRAAPQPDEAEGGAVSTVTLNGFTILGGIVLKSRDEGTEARRFVVRTPNGSEQEVVVEIAAHALKEAEQIMKGEGIDEAFWTTQAKNFLSDFIWNDGNVPTTGKLVLKSIDSEFARTLAQDQK